jgi:hypothetical protein
MKNQIMNQPFVISSFKKLSLLLLLGIIFPSVVSAQYKLNFGLKEKQPSADLPKSRGSLISVSRKAKLTPEPFLQPSGSGEWIITGGWELTQGNNLVGKSMSVFNPDYDTKDWYNATVPGTVLTTLVNQGIYPDPYVGLNNLVIPDSLCRTDWWYRTAFNMPESKDNRKIWLLFNGINYRADIWLNGRLLGNISGAFKRGMFDITDVATMKDNVLAVHIFPPPNPGIPHEESPASGPGPNGGQLCLDGPTFISSEGWDWIPGIRDRNIGIWQDVKLRMTGDIIILDPQVITDLPLPDTSSADITVRVGLKNTGLVDQKAVVTGKIQNVVFRKEIMIKAGMSEIIEFTPAEFSQLHFINPGLWWPNGYGKADLYDLVVSVTDKKGSLNDSICLRFGIREMSYELTVNTPEKPNWRVEFNPVKTLKQGEPLFDNVNRHDVVDGVAIPGLRKGVNPELLETISNTNTAPYLVIKVNGVPVFCKGGNWGMDDGMKRVSRERLEPYFRLHRDAGFNMVRNWTGESTEELFYTLCDEYGLLVWNDFWLSTEGYNLDVNDNLLFMDNAREVVRRFRNHPSIAIWCPRNEGYAPPALEEQLARLIAKEDGTRHYQPNSRYLNLRPSGPWHYFKNAADYFSINAIGFNTEQGTPSVPTAASIRKMMAPEDVWPVSDVWYYHDLHDGQKDYLMAINTLYGESSGLDEFCKKAQMVNYDSHRAMFEAWNSNMWNNTTGLLLWMTHPAWPSTVWQVYSWDYETFGSYFGSKKACEPFHVQMNMHDNKVVVVNSSLEKIDKARIKLSYFDLNGHRFYQKETVKTIGANSLTFGFVPEETIILPDVYLVRVELFSPKNKILSVNDYWKKKKDVPDFQVFNRVEKAKPILKSFAEVKSDGHLYQLVVSNASKVPAIALKLNIKDIHTGAIILPAYFSDGYFNLMPGESRTIFLDSPVAVSKEQVAFEGYNIVDW